MRVRMILVAAATLLLLAFVGISVINRGDQEVPRQGVPDLGVYLGAGDVASIAGFERWLGRGVGVRLDFLPGASWREIEDPAWQLRRWKHAGGTLVLTVPLLPGPWDRSHGGGVSLGNCRSGAYDAHWSRLARNLVEQRLGDSVLRLGHEFNGGCYVDTIGIDVYDQSWIPDTYPIPADAAPHDVLERRQRAWSGMLHGELGLEFWSHFARAHGKPLAIPEWGLTRRSDGHGGGDNPYFVEQMYRFVRDPANRVAWFIYFEHDARDGEHQLTAGHFSSAASSFRAHFGAVR